MVFKKEINLSLYSIKELPKYFRYRYNYHMFIHQNHTLQFVID
mgnify:CR=1 FL=1